jgi:hypothetical protein
VAPPAQPPAKPAAPPEPPKAAASPAPAPAAKPAALSAIAAVAAARAGIPDDPGHQKAARLARTIVADIALYNPEEVNRGVKEGSLRELLAKDLDDGKKHYKTKVAAEIQAQVDYFEVAIAGLIARKKKELGLA